MMRSPSKVCCSIADVELAVLVQFVYVPRQNHMQAHAQISTLTQEG
jgi:hypothetical protein